MRGMFTILLNDSGCLKETIVESIKKKKYYNISFIENKDDIKIYCYDYVATKYLVCVVSDNDVLIKNEKFDYLVGIFRQIKIILANG
jgi:roadblock/LC7 domain-containing protein